MSVEAGSRYPVSERCPWEYGIGISRPNRVEDLPSQVQDVLNFVRANLDDPDGLANKLFEEDNQTVIGAIAGWSGMNPDKLDKRDYVGFARYATQLVRSLESDK